MDRVRGFIAFIRENEMVRIDAYAVAAIPLSLATSILPRDQAIKWWWVLASLVVATPVVARMVADGFLIVDDQRELQPTRGLVPRLSLISIAAGIAVFAGSGPVGIYRPLLLVPLLLWAMLGGPRLLLLGGVLALGLLGAATSAQGVAWQQVTVLVIENAVSWGAIACVVGMIASRLNRSKKKSTRLHETAQRLAQLSFDAARAHDVSSAASTCVKPIAELIPCRLVELVAVNRSSTGVRQMARYPRDAASCLTPDDRGLLFEAADGVRHIDAKRSYLPIGEFDDGVLVVVLDDCEQIQEISDAGTVSAITSILTNMIERVAFLRALEQASRTDSLTGLANRRALGERLDHSYALSRRTSDPLCVVMIDVDKFKQFNDNFGHLAGDRALKTVADVLGELARPADTVGRFGGEEFCISLPNTAIAEAQTLVEQMCHAVAVARNGFKTVTISAGIAQRLASDNGVDALVRRADEALYTAKSNGRNRVEIDVSDDPVSMASAATDAAPASPT